LGRDPPVRRKNKGFKPPEDWDATVGHRAFQKTSFTTGWPKPGPSQRQPIEKTITPFTDVTETVRNEGVLKVVRSIPPNNLQTRGKGNSHWKGKTGRTRPRGGPDVISDRGFRKAEKKALHRRLAEKRKKNEVSIKKHKKKKAIYPQPTGARGGGGEQRGGRVRGNPGTEIQGHKKKEQQHTPANC